jgi:lipopolysaccharide biosynthesis regulator YciM
MRQTDFDAGKKYVDTLSFFFDKIPDRNHLVLNAQSVYYEATKEFEKALECDKKLLTLTKSQKEDIDFSSLYLCRFRQIQYIESIG